MRTLSVFIVTTTILVAIASDTVSRDKKRLNGCVYKGNIYRQGQTWNDGCGMTCRCYDAATGYYRCTDTCRRYEHLPPGCKLIKESGECCAKPNCNIPGITGRSASGGCSYHGNLYQQGQTWNDGCEYTCRCYDASIGLYRCHSNCPTYRSLPADCQLKRQPGECCARPDCNVPGVVGRRFAGTGCVYKGNTYQQGQTWNDGCGTTCRCNDASRGSYRCTSNCPTYQNLPAACQLRTQPGECCAKPDCNFQSITGGSFSGSGTGMTGSGGSGSSGSGSTHISKACATDKIPTCNQYARTVCTQQEYRQWAAENCCIYCGISYTYTGTDNNLVDANGHYSGANQGGSVSCADSIPNCVNYTNAICHDNKYSEWVLSNCPAFCGLCNGGSMTGGMTGGTGSMTGGTGSMTGGTGSMTGGTGSMTGGTGSMTGGTGSMTGGTGTMTGGGGIVPGGSYTVVCQDKVNCKNYGQTTCQSAQYAQWVRENCPVYCGICGTMTGGGSQPGGSMTGGSGSMAGGSQPGGTMTGGSGSMTGGSQPGGSMTGGSGSMTGGSQPGGSMTGGSGGSMTGGQTINCRDTIANCKDYAADICTSASYHDWAIQNCAGFCNLCGGSGTGTMTGGTGTMTGGSGTMPGGSGTMPGGSGTMTGGSGTMPGGSGTMPGGSGTMPGGSGTMPGGTGTMPGGSGTMTGGTCSDTIANCASYDKSTCTDAKFASWAKANCAKYCNMCSSGTGSTGTMTGGGSTGGSMIGSSCHDAISNCADLDRSNHICTDAGAKVYATQNCPLTCNLCSSMSGGSMIGGNGGTMTGGSGGSMTGGNGGSMTGGNGGSMTGGTGGSMTGGSMSGGSSFTTCTDTLNNCKDYGNSVCSKPEYSQWVKSNCAGFCHLCGGSSMGGSGTMTGGSGSGSTGGGMTGGSSFNNPYGTHGGFISQGGQMTGQSSGCAHNGQVYQQGQSWRDGCKFQCTCTDASQGQYQCTSLCPTWNLAPQCHLEQPAAGKCCSTPSCPAGVQIQYPPNYVAN